MIDDIAVGIKSKFDNSTTLKGLVTGNMHRGQAIENTVYPYIVFKFIDDLSDDTFTEEMDSLRIQFSIFTDQTNYMATGGMKAISEALVALYNHTALTISGAVHVGTRRLNTLDQPILDKVLHRTIDFEIAVTKV